MNLMSGMSIAHTHEMQHVVLDYADALPAAAFALGYFADMRRVCSWTLEAAQALNDPHALAKCWRVWGQACIEQADYDEAQEHLMRSLDLCRQLGDLAGVAGAQYDLARIAIFRVEYNQARQWLADSQRILEALRDERGLAGIHYRQAAVAYYEREFAEADRLAQQALAIQRQLADKPHGIQTLTLLADIALHGRDNLGEAEQYCMQALTWCNELQNDSDRTTVLATLAEIHRRQGNFDAARAEAETFLHLVRRMGDRKSQAHALFRLSQIDTDRHDYPAARHNAVLSLELCRQLHDRWGEVYVAHHLGRVYIQLRQSDQARNLWQEAFSLAESLQHPLVETLRECLKE